MVEHECCDQRCALVAILQSVAMQETALANILAGEAEKLKKAICIANCPKELLEINESIARTLKEVAEIEESLKDKACCAIQELKDLRQKKHC